MWRGLAHAIENALARAFGRSAAQAIGDWWGWAPLGWALLAALFAFLILRALRLPRQRLLAMAAALIVFTGTAFWSPVQVWLNERAIQSAATNALRAALIEPRSARVDDISMRHLDMGDTIVCGWVNAKARNGAFQGPQLFSVILTPEREARMMSVDSACYASEGRDLLSDSEQCETTVRAERLMLSGAAHNICGVDAASIPASER